MADSENDARRYAAKRDLTFIYGHDKDGNEGKVSALAVVEKLTANTFTPVDGDNGKIKIIADASGVAVTLPKDKPVGYAVRVIQGGAGGLTFAAQSGASAVGTLTTAAQWAGLTALVIDQGINGDSAAWLVG